MTAVGILGVGHALPKRVVTNEDIVKMGVNTSDQWIVDRTGIKERRIAGEDETTCDLAYEAARHAISHAGLAPHDIDMLIVATTSPDYLVFPSVAALLQDRLGLRHVGAFDLSAACTGFCYALTTGSQFIKTKEAKYVLVVGADCLSKYVNWKDRSVCILFGDGAGAVVLGPVQEGYGLLSSKLCADGSAGSILKVEGGGVKNPFSQDILDRELHYIKMDGPAVFKMAVNRIVPCVMDALTAAGLQSSDISFFIPHQANLRIIEHVRDRLNLTQEQMIVCIQKYGNTSAASIPIAISEEAQASRFKNGDIVVLTGFGAGFTWAANVIRWGGI